MPQADVVPIADLHEKKVRKAHKALTAAKIAHHRSEADFLERPSERNRLARDSALEMRRTMQRRFNSAVRAHADATEAEA